MFGGEAHDPIVRGGGVPDRSSDAVAAREGLVACVFFASDGRSNSLEITEHHAIAATHELGVFWTPQGAADERGLGRFAARRRGPDRARHPRAAVRERRRSFSARRRDGGCVVAEDEVEVVWFGSSRRVRDLLGLEQDQDLCCFFLFFLPLSACVFAIS